ncbi:DUF7344 domain-containing protein [Halosolutus gelatinilyticus]|uniref:DUF7344 domain-containing protein n=1 Tax=Halosolutus gelatinilyticus TaxID=2931975 RepID=UPI001FF40930|nr:ArsR family transcriptional regulator [Halosolutus gelatinilyticus]
MINDVFNILADDYRRCTLIALLEETDRREETSRTANRHLPDDVALGEAGRDKRILELRHCHLPMLADSELIAWDRDANEIARGPRFDEAKPLLELLADHSDDLPEGWVVTPPLR